MGNFGYRQSFRVGPGLRVNLSKSGVSVSAGPKGATLNVGPKGARSTLRMPGGLSYVQRTSWGLAGPRKKRRKS